MRNTLIGVVSSAAIGAALLAATTSARAQYDQGPAPGYGAPPPAYQAPGYNGGFFQAPPPANPTYQAPPPAPAPAAASNPGGDIFVNSNYHPVVYGKAYGPDAAGPGEPTQGGVCWMFPPDTRGGKWQEVCR